MDKTLEAKAAIIFHVRLAAIVTFAAPLFRGGGVHACVEMFESVWPDTIKLREAALKGDASRLPSLVERTAAGGTGTAPVDVRFDGDRTALMLAAARGRAEFVRGALRLGASRGAEDAQGRSALWHAEANGHEACAELLRTWEPPEGG